MSRAATCNGAIGSERYDKTSTRARVEGKEAETRNFFRLLSVRHERPSHCGGTKKCDELTALHCSP